MKQDALRNFLLDNARSLPTDAVEQAATHLKIFLLDPVHARFQANGSGQWVGRMVAVHVDEFLAVQVEDAAVIRFDVKSVDAVPWNFDGAAMNLGEIGRAQCRE